MCDQDCECELSGKEENETSFKMKTLFIDDSQFNIMHPDDPLMQRFQNALKAHLIRMDDKLSEEIREIRHTLKSVNKQREDGGYKLRNLELEILDQRKAIECYENMCSDAQASREHHREEIEKAQVQLKKKSDELNDARTNHLNLTKQMEQLSLQDKWYSTLENEIASEVSISRRISEKDAQVQREMLRDKKQKDYILFKLDEEIWKIDSERRHLESQLQIREEDKKVIGQAICDANTELEALQKELKVFVKNLNLIILYIRQRDEISFEQNAKRREMQDLLTFLQKEIDNIQQETANEMENNELLTELKAKIDKELDSVTKEFESQKEKNEDLECELGDLAKITEQCEKDSNETLTKLQTLQNNENELDKELAMSNKSKTDLEDKILEKLNETMLQDKTIRSLNKQLQEVKKKNKEHEFMNIQIENTHSKNLLTIQKIMTAIEEEKFNLQELVKVNIEKEKKLEKMQTDVKKCETTIGVREAKIVNLKNKIQEMLHSTKGQEVNVLKLKIKAIEQSIGDVEAKNQQSQKLWLRQQGNLIDLREQRNNQLQELGLLTKQIMIIEQKNFKLEYELEKQRKEYNNINRKISELQQLLIQKNTRLAARKDFKQQLEDINYITRNECSISLEEAEKELMSLQLEIKELKNKKEMLKNTLYDLQLESLSWEKKVEMACEASKTFKEERKGIGDIATMKNEIHKMQMRLSHLKKFQQKLIQDMEFCISRRENVLERVIADEKRNPKNEHNRRIIVQKRFDDQRLKIKQMNKEVKQLEDEILKLEDIQKDLEEKMELSQKVLRENEIAIPDLDKQIMEAELIKNHNLEILIRKQRKGLMLQKIKNGNYKFYSKSDITLDDEIRRQKTMNEDLKEILSQTKIDFPLLKNEIRKILISLDAE